MGDKFCVGDVLGGVAGIADHSTTFQSTVKLPGKWMGDGGNRGQAPSDLGCCKIRFLGVCESGLTPFGHA